MKKQNEVRFWGMLVICFTFLSSAGCALIASGIPCDGGTPKPVSRPVVTEPVETRVAGVYVGVVAFNQRLMVHPLSDDLSAAKRFIDARSNVREDFTALCAAVSRGVDEFKAFSRKLDDYFIVTFTDGDDNYSGPVYSPEIAQGRVYDRAVNDLRTEIGGNKILAYAIGAGPAIRRLDDLQRLVSKPLSTYYVNAGSGAELQVKFAGIAQSIKNTMRNVTLMVNNVLWTDQDARYFKITINNDATVICRWANNVLTRLPGGSNRLQFEPGMSRLSSRQGKRLIPLNKVRYINEAGADQKFNDSQFAVEVSEYPNKGFRPDTEEAGFSEEQTNLTGVMIILDCTSSLDSLGASTFNQMKVAAKDFIDVLAATAKNSR
ncbi:MAG: hypothetical protein LBC99_09340 [Spirochaetota bacterium]|nr:hypothetical protein [Spirochaetota bacterium]